MGFPDGRRVGDDDKEGEYDGFVVGLGDELGSSDGFVVGLGDEVMGDAVSVFTIETILLEQSTV